MPDLAEQLTTFKEHGVNDDDIEEYKTCQVQT